MREKAQKLGLPLSTEGASGWARLKILAERIKEAEEKHRRVEQAVRNIEKRAVMRKEIP